MRSETTTTASKCRRNRRSRCLFRANFQRSTFAAGEQELLGDPMMDVETPGVLAAEERAERQQPGPTMTQAVLRPASLRAMRQPRSWPTLAQRTATVPPAARRPNGPAAARQSRTRAPRQRRRRIRSRAVGETPPAPYRPHAATRRRARSSRRGRRATPECRRTRNTKDAREPVGHATATGAGLYSASRRSTIEDHAYRSSTVARASFAEVRSPFGVAQEGDRAVGKRLWDPRRARCRVRPNVQPFCPSGVETTGFAIAIASRIFSRVPDPMRNGTTATAARARYGRTSGTRPVTSTPGNRWSA